MPIFSLEEITDLEIDWTGKGEELEKALYIYKEIMGKKKIDTISFMAGFNAAKGFQELRFKSGVNRIQNKLMKVGK